LHGFIGAIKPGIGAVRVAFLLTQRRQGLTGEGVDGFDGKCGFGGGARFVRQAGTQIKNRQAALGIRQRGIDAQGAPELPFGFIQPVKLGIGKGEVELDICLVRMKRRLEFPLAQDWVGGFDFRQEHRAQAFRGQQAWVERQGAFDRQRGSNVELLRKAFRRHADLNSSGAGVFTTNSMAPSGPTPGFSPSRRQTSLEQCNARSLASISAICACRRVNS
jgi:hypothetical protein